MGRNKKEIRIRLKSKIIGNFLAELRISKKELSKRANIDYQYLLDLLSNDPPSEPSYEKIGDIAQVLNAKPWQITEGLEPPPTIGTVREGVRASAAFDAVIIHKPPSPIYGGQTQDIYNLLEKSHRAGLTDIEIKALEDTLGQMVDLLTIEEPGERKKYATLIQGMIELCHKQLPRTGKEKEESVAK